MRWLPAILLTACAGAQSPAMQKSTADVDQDGVIDVDDQCPYDRGTAPTGCPEPTPPTPSVIEPVAGESSPPPPAGASPAPSAAGDRDGDGIPDSDDRCPDEPEDRDAFEDADGCPDPDNDGDGLADAADRCPAAAEDKDGFEDDDGCPDPDNDRDGILDMNDRCPDRPETVNSRADTDGCPD